MPLPLCKDCKHIRVTLLESPVGGGENSRCARANPGRFSLVTGEYVATESVTKTWPFCSRERSGPAGVDGRYCGREGLGFESRRT